MMAAAALYVGLMMATIVYYTSCRALGIAYSSFSFAFIEFGFIYVLMLGGPWLVRTRGHVHIELLTAAVPERVRQVLSRTVAALCVLTCLALAWYTGLLTWNEYAGNKYDELRAHLDIKRWIITVSMPVGFGLMGIEFVRYVFGRELLHSGKAGVSGEG
ncbi:MAG TPA: TRAP transporter small permease [Burkholderiales bacterium]|nr:TRAP transporter small permease [Burkholderiales bacterium]